MMKFAISSWSVDGLLSSDLPLLELPAAMREQNIGTLELCHFHLPSIQSDYLSSFRAALEAAGIELYSVLIDTGDLASPDPDVISESVRTIRRYIDAAEALGAERVRITTGLQPATPDVLAQVASHLTELMAYAAERKLATSIENWQPTAEQPEDLLTILASAPESLGLCADTGNAEATPDKYETLDKLMPRATSVHFKARRQDGKIDEEDVRRCLQSMADVSFSGPVSLIYDGKSDEWQEIGVLREVLSAQASPSPTA